MTPIAVGEIFNTIYDCQTLITEQLIDFIRTTVVHAGGITHLRRIAHLAELYHVRTGSHGATDLSPVCMGAALNFDTWVHNFGIQEYMRHTPETDAVFPHTYYFKDGYLHPGSSAGAWGRYRRNARGEVSVQAERVAGEPPGRRLDVELVAARGRSEGTRARNAWGSSVTRVAAAADTSTLHRERSRRPRREAAARGPMRRMGIARAESTQAADASTLHRETIKEAAARARARGPVRRMGIARGESTQRGRHVDVHRETT